MTDVLFISETKLRQFTDLNNNVDSELLKNAIREAQDIEIQRIIGTKLYKRLIAGIKASDLNSNETELLNDYIADAEIYWAYYYSLDSLFIRPRNNGILVADGGDNSSSVDVDLYTKKRETIKDKAEWYSELLATFLLDNKQNFPELQLSTDLHEKEADYGNQFRSPFVLRSDRYRGINRLGIQSYDSRYPYLPQ